RGFADRQFSRPVSGRRRSSSCRPALYCVMLSWLERESMIHRYRLFIGLLLAVIASAVAQSPVFAQAIRSQTNRVTNAIQNQVRQAIRPHLTVRNAAGEVVSLAMSPDGRLLLIALQDRSLRLWDLRSGIEQNRIDVGGEIIRISRI